MRACQHGLSGNFRERLGEDLFGGRFALEDITLGTGATHAKRIPPLRQFQRILILEEHRHHLIVEAASAWRGR